jgi:hypothetical protein
MSTLNVKYGLHDPRPGAIPLRLATYLHHSLLPTPPPKFGHMGLIDHWGMLGNGQSFDNPPEIPDGVGDCAVAGPEHQIMLDCKESGTSVSFSVETTIKNYSEMTGYVLGDQSTDNGTAIDAMAQHWLNVGIADDAGNRHKVVAVVDLNPGDLRELWVAMYLFQSVGLGFALPESAEEQTARGEAWDYVRGANIVGGHYVPAFNKLSTDLIGGVSWGAGQPFTNRFFTKFNNQGVVVLDEEALTNMRNIDGFDDRQLRDDIKQVRWL